jgi:hypothetical protein
MQYFWYWVVLELFKIIFNAKYEKLPAVYNLAASRVKR